MKAPTCRRILTCCGLLALGTIGLSGCEKSTPADTTAPAAPVLLASPPDSAWDESGTDAIPEEDWIQVAWLASQEDDLEGYKIYRSAPPLNIPALLATQTLGSAETDTLFDDTTVELGVRYTYTVTAFDRSGNESGKSEEVNYMLIPKLEVENLTSPRGTISDRRPIFSWLSTGESIENYLRVYDSAEDRIVWVSDGQNPFSSPHALPYDENGTASDSLLLPGREYWWRVDRTGGELRSGSESNWVSFTIEN
jgi:hypothetical protein